MPLGEADRILTLHTRNMGKVRAVAKGVRRPRSRLGGHLELLNHVSVSLSVGRNLDVVNEAEIVRSFTGFRDDLSRLSRAIYLSELVDRFTVEGSSSYDVYRMLLGVFDRLDRSDESDLLLRHFEVHILEASGYRPELQSCVSCRSTLMPGDHHFSCANGGVFCPECRGVSADALILVSIGAMKVLRLLQRERDYSGVADVTVSAGILVEVERLLRTYIRYLIERELKSAEFMNLVSSQASTPAPH
jgi:DNA repair protein RecO (recombination protein O)